ncbi:MAG: hypothetical protein Q4E65_04095 [Clostridia bacterium]|nr:hypothetical protein [Clostridia bacterium]
MRALRQKLHSQRGASILVALLFFLVCMMVGGVVLTAAAANAGRLTHLRQDQQTYFILSSAVRLVRDDLQGAVFTVKETKTGDADATTEYPDPETDAQLQNVYLKKQLCAWARQVYTGERAQNVPIPFTVMSEGGRTVYGTAYMQGKGGASPYSIEAFFTLPAKEGTAASPSKSSYDLRLYIPATLALREQTSMTLIDGKEVRTLLTTTTVTYGAGIISQAGEESA